MGFIHCSQRYRLSLKDRVHRLAESSIQSAASVVIGNLLMTGGRLVEYHVDYLPVSFIQRVLVSLILSFERC